MRADRIAGPWGGLGVAVTRALFLNRPFGCGGCNQGEAVIPRGSNDPPARLENKSSLISLIWICVIFICDYFLINLMLLMVLSIFAFAS